MFCVCCFSVFESSEGNAQPGNLYFCKFCFLLCVYFMFKSFCLALVLVYFVFLFIKNFIFELSTVSESQTSVHPVTVGVRSGIAPPGGSEQ